MVRSKTANVLSTLELSNVTKVKQLDKAETRREKLLKGLEEQKAAAEAMLQGDEYFGKKMVWETNDEGERVRVAKEKRINKWFYKNDDGRCYLEVRYANKALELAQGKTSIVVDKAENLTATIDKVMDAVRAKELDDAIAAVVKLKSDTLRGYKGK